MSIWFIKKLIQNFNHNKSVGGQCLLETQGWRRDVGLFLDQMMWRVQSRHGLLSQSGLRRSGGTSLNEMKWYLTKIKALIQNLVSRLYLNSILMHPRSKISSSAAGTKTQITWSHDTDTTKSMSVFFSTQINSGCYANCIIDRIKILIILNNWEIF